VSEESFGRYILEDLLGEGGMGQVYRAFDTETDRVVALKLLPAKLADDEDYKRRFRREAKTAASLSDPHAVPIHHFGEIDGRLYVDMRLIEGRDLGSVLASRTPMDEHRAVAIVEQIAEVLQAAHNAGLVHRDIKPSNVLLTDRNFAYLIDFGIAIQTNETRLTRTGLAIGTLAYMAPERFGESHADPRSDVYSLTCLLYECLTGAPPFGEATLEQLLAAHLTKEPPRPSTRRADLRAFDSVIARGMAKDPDDRYQAAIDLATAARRALASESVDQQANSRTVQAPDASAQSELARSGDTVSATQFALGKANTGGSQRPKSGVAVRSTTSGVNEQRRKDAMQRLQEQLEQQETRAGQRRMYATAGAAIAVIALVATLVVVLMTRREPNSDEATTPTSLPTSSAPPASGALPPFAPPVGLGDNCQYPPTLDGASKPNTPPRSGKVPTDPAVISASMETNQGDIGLMLDNAKAPCTVNSFASLAQQGYFNGTSCHRLTTAEALSVLQCGDPTGQGTGGPGYRFANEYPTDQYQPDNPKLMEPVTYPRGTLAMANAGPGTNGSQFFLVYQDSQLPPNYTVFGTIDQTGLATLDKIAAAGVVDGGDDGKPNLDIRITSILLD
jgi:serine/threonine protein kinase/cyclophilin family peptidyl-prolyl cis-trans isomerase